MSSFLAILAAAVVGVCIALEPTVNSALGKVITPRLATFHSFVVGMVAIVIINILSGGFKGYSNVLKVPPYLWIGGLLGLTVILGGAWAAGVIGVASTVTVMVAVQMVTGIVIDSLGLFGATKVPIDMSRIIGVVLLVIAVKLIIK